MFNQARIKLTAWYLIIIMMVSFFFSLIIYRGLIGEIDRVSKLERFRIERAPFQQQNFRPVILDPDAVTEIKNRILFVLISINGIILISAGGLGYFLAGMTLKPISEMVEEQNRFISDASHELRTPLTSLKTAIEVGLRDKKMDLLNAKKLIEDNLIEINNLQSLSDNLLLLTQYKNKSNPLKFERISLKKIINNSISRVNILAKNKRINIKTEIKDGKIRGNEYSLTDLFVILFDNAIKYSKNNSEIKLFSIIKNKKIYISIKDKGIGIDKKDLPHIFERFYRADKARGRTGYGLGLSIAKKIVETHKGDINFQSEVNKGTTVTITLPIFS